MRQNFFEVIGMADVERVHSQMLAWVFGSRVLTAAQKSEILSELSGQVGEHSQFLVSTEHDHIDILIETDSLLFVIENKIKITEHDQQLSRYQMALERHVLPRRFIYLSLLPEKFGNISWVERSYEELHDNLSRHRFNSPSQLDEYLFNEYVEAVGHLAAVVKAFDQDHRRFPNVFTDGNLTKLAKRSLISRYTDPQNYVRANQLETALQRYFVRKVGERIVPNTAKCRIEETRGTALLQTVFASRSIHGIIFDWGVQFQGQTAKLNCMAREYAESTLDQLPSEVLADFKKMRAKHNSLRFNEPRAKAYVSLSKRLDFSWSDEFDKIVDLHAAAYDELSRIGLGMATAHGTAVPIG